LEVIDQPPHQGIDSLLWPKFLRDTLKCADGGRPFVARLDQRRERLKRFHFMAGHLDYGSDGRSPHYRISSFANERFNLRVERGPKRCIRDYQDGVQRVLKP